MKFYSAIIPVLILFTSAVSAQTLTGRYESANQQELAFTGDSVKYTLNTGGCLYYIYNGKSTFTITKKRLLIAPVLKKDTELFKSTLIAPKSKENICFKVFTKNNIPIIGASVIVIRNHKMSFGAATNISGDAIFVRDKLLATDSIRVIVIGYFSATFKPGDWSSDYKVTLFEGVTDKGEYLYVSNQGKGYKFKQIKNSLKINFEKQSACGMQDNWVEFKRVDNL